jgi:hypothetical protein
MNKFTLAAMKGADRPDRFITGRAVPVDAPSCCRDRFGRRFARAAIQRGFLFDFGDGT